MPNSEKVKFKKNSIENTFRGLVEIFQFIYGGQFSLISSN